MFKSVSCFNATSEIAVVSEYLFDTIYKSLYCDNEMLKEDVMLGGASNLLWLFYI
jgi:hypothetical protein